MVSYEKHVTLLNCFKRNGLDNVPHFHTEVEIVLCTRGYVQAIIDGETYSLNPGEACIVFPNQIHGYANSTQGTEGSVLITATNYLGTLSGTFFKFRPVNPVFVRKNFEKELDYLIEKKDSDSKYKMSIMEGASLLILGEVLENLELVERNAVSSEDVQQILAFCENNFSDPSISLSTVSKNLGISPFYVSRIFSNVIKVSFSQYINHLRIRRAAKLLTTTTMNITEISLSAGYSTIRSFNRQFIREKGVTPRQYRASFHNDNSQ